MLLRVSRVLVAVAVGLASVEAAGADTYEFREDRVLGTTFHMKVAAENQSSASLAKEAALARIRDLDAVLSTWRNDSEIAGMNDATQSRVSEDLFNVLFLCEQFLETSGNAFSCRVGTLMTAWREAEQSGVAPLAITMQGMADAIARATVGLDADTRIVQKPANVKFDVNAVAKGWIIDAAVKDALAASPLVTGVMVNIGGDLRVAGDFSVRQFRVGVATGAEGMNETPAEIVRLVDAAIASSGRGGRDLVVGEELYSHIISPRTGMPQDRMAQATVVAPDGATADALATAFMVMGIGEALEYANTRDGIETMLRTEGGARFTSNGWAELVVPPEDIEPTMQADNPWPDGYRVTLDYTIPAQDTASYEYPYVVIWVTDAEKNLVRGLQLLGDIPLWVEENYVFWRRYGRKQPAIVDTIAEPTRPPGDYSLGWDGKDLTGNPVSKGSYIIHIEASREHGGHQYESFEVNLGDRAFAESIGPGNELGTIEVGYGR
ncbi:DUF2271 domain-containing protein [Parvularcula flava]|uniref:FAD:protein FMN transferase n=1 Tax=Aquisalinus luteolus TaxID=1566827 RepID=A0A8J3EP53_9PROT|nr:DUF2271 domain-containing protein [Aquisalinus luteolus]NHK27143.1 DUF2271 domain-containing protein [Aquisalinus luteolus]GGH94530.1 hypothetical protein GCM10011355_08930 [Aquisalinus luteolus]